MKTHKKISYGLSGRDKTPMQVLHTILPAMFITGFYRGRMSIFEEECHARIEYRSLASSRVKIGRRSRLKRAGNDNDITFTLDINVVPQEGQVGAFDIFSEVTPG